MNGEVSAKVEVGGAPSAAALDRLVKYAAALTPQADFGGFTMGEDDVLELAYDAASDGVPMSLYWDDVEQKYVDAFVDLLDSLDLPYLVTVGGNRRRWRCEDGSTSEAVLDDSGQALVPVALVAEAADRAGDLAELLFAFTPNPAPALVLPARPAAPPPLPLGPPPGLPCAAADAAGKTGRVVLCDVGRPEPAAVLVFDDDTHFVLGG